MSKMKLLLCAFVTSVVMMPLTASATGYYTMDSTPGGWAVAGAINGVAWIGTSYNNGASCTHWQKLSTTSSLQQPWVITGSQYNDFIMVVDGALAFCGYNMTPIGNGGFDLTIDGGSGNDLISGGFAGTLVGGNDGDDAVYGAAPYVKLLGMTGHDLMVGYSTTATLDGYSGTDIGCAQTATRAVRYMFGGSNNKSPGDRRCGIGTTSTTGWEVVGCESPCY